MRSLCCQVASVMFDSLPPYGLTSLLGPSLHGILQAGILQWVAAPSSMEPSQPSDWTHVSCISRIGRQVLYHWCHLGSPIRSLDGALIQYGVSLVAQNSSEHRRIDTFELWCWRRLLRVPWTARRSNQSILKEISPEYSLEGLMLKLKL